MTLATVLILALATYRAARLVTTDSLTDSLRERVKEWAWDSENARAEPDERGQITYVPIPRGGAWRTYAYELIRCPHCMGVWFAFAAVLIFHWYAGSPDWSFGAWIVYVAAVAGAQSALASFTSKADA